MLKDKRTIDESNIEAEATIEMSLRTEGGMKKKSDERIANMEKKFSTVEEAGKTKTEEYNKVLENPEPRESRSNWVPWRLD